MNYSKLRVEIREALERDRNEFPNLVEAIRRDIEGAVIVSDLKIRNAAAIVGYFRELNLKSTNNLELDLYRAFEND